MYFTVSASCFFYFVCNFFLLLLIQYHLFDNLCNMFISVSNVSSNFSMVFLLHLVQILVVLDKYIVVCFVDFYFLVCLLLVLFYQILQKLLYHFHNMGIFQLVLLFLLFFRSYHSVFYDIF